jgi:hypothetical protein
MLLAQFGVSVVQLSTVAGFKAAAVLAAAFKKFV